MENRVLIVEDENRMAALIKRGLEEHGFEASIAPDGNSALAQFGASRFDLLLLDINLPGMNGYEVCKRIRAEDAQVPILMLTAFSATDDKLKGFDMGADDYIVKPFEFKELLARIKVFLKRKDVPLPNQQNMLRMGDLELDINRKKANRAGQEISLTAKEFALLEYFMLNPYRVISRAEISSKIWDIDFDTGTNVIDVYVNYLRKKIDRDFDKKLIQTQIGMGYIMTDES